MVKKIILLAGTPASGKDTVCNILSKQKHFVFFKKHKGFLFKKIDPKKNYTNITPEKFKDMIEKKEFVQWHKRYDRYYGVSYSQLEEDWSNSKIPIIHTGRLENIKTIEKNIKKIKDKLNIEVEIIKILFLLSKKETVKRLIFRHDNDKIEINKRLKAYDEEIKDLKFNDFNTKTKNIEDIKSELNFNYIIVNKNSKETADFLIKNLK